MQGKQGEMLVMEKALACARYSRTQPQLPPGVDAMEHDHSSVSGKCAY